MKQIAPTNNEHHWPRSAVESIECRKRDLVIRIADWTRNKEEPAYDVEVYIGGVYDWNQSEVFPTCGDKNNAKNEAIAFANKKIAELL
jgi:hypothetical protein